MSPRPTPVKAREFLTFVAPAVVAIVGVFGCDRIAGHEQARSAAVEWDGPIEEIASSDITKDGKVFTIKMESRIDAPPGKVWAAMKHPEMLSKNSDQYKKSDLLKDEGDHKEIEIHMMILDAEQWFNVAMDFNNAAQTLKVKTLTTSFADIDGTYSLVPSPDGQKTLYVYNARQIFKVAFPLADDVYRSAIKEMFVNQLRAIKKQLAADQPSR